MPRKKKTIVEETIPDNVLTTDDGENIMFDDTPIDEVFDSFGEEPFLMKVYKITPTGSSFVFSSTEKPNSSTFESSIQERCPSGGKFVVRFYKNNRIIEPSRHIEIEPRPIATNPNTSNMESIYAMQVKMLSDQLMTMQNMVMAFIGRPTPVTQQTPMSELVAAMTAMHGIQPTKSDPVDLILKGMEIGSKTNGASPDWKSELIHTAKDVLAPVAEIVAQYKMQPSVVSNPSNNVPQIEERTANGMKIPTLLIKSGLASLKPKILSGMLEPGLAVDWILANATDAMYQPFLAVALQGDINTFIQIDPELANEPYRTWVETTINMLKGAYAANNNQTHNDGRDGDNTDVTTDENVSLGIPVVSKAG